MMSYLMFFWHSKTGVLKKFQNTLFLLAVSTIFFTNSPAWAAAPPEEHRGLPQLNPAYVSPQVFWLFITFLALCIIMSLTGTPRIQKVLKARDITRTADIKQATALRDMATAMVKKYEEKLATTHQEAQDLLARTTAAATKEAAARKQALEIELQNQQKAAEQKIDEKRREALTHIHTAAENLITDIINQVASLKASPEDIRKILSGLKHGGEK